MKKFLAVALLSPLFIPAAASAHGIGEVYSLPIPLEYYLLGAGVAVALSFLAIAVFFNKPIKAHRVDRKKVLPWLKPVLTTIKLAGVLLLSLTIIAGIIGQQNPVGNIAPVLFWIYFVVGMGLLSLVISNIWDKINPWKAMSNWLDVKSDNRDISGFVGVLLLLGLFWFELVSGQSFVPNVLGFVLLAYTLVNIIMAKFYQNWYQDGELFSVFFGFVGKLARYKIGEDNKSIITVNQTNKLKGSPASWWVLGTATVLLAGTSFDSLKETVLWFQWTAALGFSSSSIIAPTIGIILAPLPFLALYMLAIRVMKKLVGKKYRTTDLAKRFVWSLVPIAFGYFLAHSFSLVVVSAPQILALVSDPLGNGWNLFGTASFAQANLIVGAKTVWFIEIGLIVLAHIGGVIYAHVLALNIFKDPKLALKSQYPLLVLMIGITFMTLWLLSQPLVVQG